MTVFSLNKETIALQNDALWIIAEHNLSYMEKESISYDY